MEKFDFEETRVLKPGDTTKHMNCFCEKEVAVDEVGDWDSEENEKVIREEDERYLAYGIDDEGFYIAFWYFTTESCVMLRPVHCPICGRKLREEEKVEM